MMRFLGIVGWLVAGHLVLAALYWSLLLVPESNAWMLVLSLLLVLLILVVASTVEIAAALAYFPDRSFRSLAPAGVTRLHAFVVGAIVFLLALWISIWLDAWHVRHAGELDAWLLLHFAWRKTAWLHRAIDWVLWCLTFVVGLSIALTTMVGIARDGRRALTDAGARLGRAVHPIQLVLLTVWMLLVVYAPWQAVSWHPKSLPPTAIEPLFVAAKLGAIFLVMNIGWALVLRTIARRAI